jgi:hypothetical protein
MKWTKDEEKLLHAYIDKYESVEELPLTHLSERLNRTTDAVLRKAKRLVEAYNSAHQWINKERKIAFDLYVAGESYARIQESLPEVSIDAIETEMARLRKLAEGQLRAYAEERGLQTTKNISLGQLEFFLKNRETTSEFVRKGLHSRIKNG